MSPSPRGAGERERYARARRDLWLDPVSHLDIGLLDLRVFATTLGEPSVIYKHLFASLPVRLFALTGVSLAVLMGPSASVEAADKPSIAVLPLRSKTLEPRLVEVLDGLMVSQVGGVASVQGGEPQRRGCAAGV